MSASKPVEDKFEVQIRLSYMLYQNVLFADQLVFHK